MLLYLAPGVVEFRVNDLIATSETEVSWSPPLQPNGVITSYQVIYSVYQSSAIVTSEMLSNTTNTYIIRNLGMLMLQLLTIVLLYAVSFIDPGTPYQVTVVAFTNAGRGALNNNVVFFSEELMPEMFPTNITYTRLNNASINVTWTPLSLSEAQGFPLYQAILTEDSTNSGATSDVATTINSFAIFTNLSIDQQYTLLVGVATGNNRSAFVYSNPLTGM